MVISNISKNIKKKMPNFAEAPKPTFDFSSSNDVKHLKRTLASQC